MSRECQAYIRGYLMGLNFSQLSIKPRSPIETIYTLGGRNSQRCLCTAERFVPEEDRWEVLPSMKQVSPLKLGAESFEVLKGSYGSIGRRYRRTFVCSGRRM